MILETSSVSATPLASVFSHPVDYLFILFMVSLGVKKLLSLIMSNVFIVIFLFPLLWDTDQKRYCCNLCHRVFCLCFPLKNFIVSGLTFRSLISF